MQNPAPAQPAKPDASRAAFWQMLQRIAVLAGAVNIVFLIVFWLVGQYGMALVNVASLVIYGAAYALLRRRRNLPAVLLMWAEVLTHSSTNTLLFGWDTGAHYFLLVFLPAVAVSRSPRQAVGAMAFVLVTYLGLDAATQVIPVTYSLPPDVMTGMRWLSITAVFIMFGYTGRYYVARVSETEARLQQLATTDPLSGLLNRRRLTELAQQEVRRATRYGAPVAVALADIDHFKQVNDRHGHAAGDAVIQHVAGLLRQALRPHDLIGRWGGEEFILVLPATDAQGAAAACERICDAVRRTPCELDARGALSVTLSIGLHILGPQEALQQGIDQADRALYAAKGRGRDRVVASPATA